MSDLERKIGGLEVTKRMCLGDNLMPEECADCLTAVVEMLIDSKDLRLTNRQDRATLAKRILWTLGIEPP